MYSHRVLTGITTALLSAIVLGCAGPATETGVRLADAGSSPASTAGLCGTWQGEFSYIGSDHQSSTGNSHIMLQVGGDSTYTLKWGDHRPSTGRVTARANRVILDDQRTCVDFSSLEPVHPAPDREGEHPLVQAHAANPKGILHALGGTGHETVERHRDPESQPGHVPTSSVNQAAVSCRTVRDCLIRTGSSPHMWTTREGAWSQHPSPVRARADGIIRRWTNALASGTGPGEPARGRFLLFQVHHRRLAVFGIPYHSVERAAGVNQRDP